MRSGKLGTTRDEGRDGDMNADNSCCDNDGCPSRMECLRYMTERARMQLYSAFEPDESGKCYAFVEIMKGDKLREVDDA